MKRQIKRDETIGKVIAFAKPIAHWIILSCLLSIGGIVCGVLSPTVLGDLVQMLYDYWEGGRVGTVTDQLVRGLVILLGLYGMQSFLSWVNMVLMNHAVSRYFCCNLRIAISDKIRRLPVKYVDQTPVGDILSRMMGDVSEMSGYIYQIIDVFINGVIQLVVIGGMMLHEDWRLGLFVVVITPISVMLSSKIASKSETFFDSMFELSGKRTQVVEESFSNFATGKAYNLEASLEEKHEKVNRQQMEANIKASFISASVQPLIAMFNSLAYIFINLIGGWFLVQGGLEVGSVVTIVLFARQFATPLEQIAYGFGQMERIKASSRRVFEILDMEEEPLEEGALDAPCRGEVEFRDVSFSYDPKQPLLENLNLTVHPGQKVAIVGPTGAGKTTIVNLLMRFYDVNQGQILLDGKPVSDMSREEIRNQFGMVLQDTWLFRGTIAQNVAYGKPDATREEMEEACRKTYCDRFIRTMPQGYETMVGEDTANLSGGQKQLLTIARALLADKPLLILDEATSNVDTRTEVLIQKAMDQLMKGRTCFVVAHRLSTIVDSDLILVLNQGQIVEQGTHESLLAKKGFYYQLYSSQYAI